MDAGGALEDALGWRSGTKHLRGPQALLLFPLFLPLPTPLLLKLVLQDAISLVDGGRWWGWGSGVGPRRADNRANTSN